MTKRCCLRPALYISAIGNNFIFIKRKPSLNKTDAVDRYAPSERIQSEVRV
uniref:Uncharacterized protein n=1 Tax=Magnetospirillum gryphiswaldense TaxID=55518 RepID=A4U4J2_9PROT|nr:hypothetical protein MGR_3867 [Magnetospirillum gryphiswaldense MSR-1]